MWYSLTIVIGLVILSGMYSGLTLALFSLNLTTLEREMITGSRTTKKVYEIRKQGNFLLCTLLLGNVASYSVMAVYLGSITSGVVASIIATSLIFVFGEILPQAVFPRYAIQIGSRLSLLVKISMVVFFPIAAPIAWLLDKTLGEEPIEYWSKKELGEIIKYYKDYGDGIIDQDEERIIQGALSFSELQIKEIMIRQEHVFYLQASETIDDGLLKLIKTKGYSRVPVYDSEVQNIIGILFSNDLIGVQPGRHYDIGQLARKETVITVRETMQLDDLLNLLINTKQRLAVVINENNHFAGIVTMEDVIEIILNTDIENE